MSGWQPAAAAEISTSVVEPQHAFEYWRDLICDTFVQLNAAPTLPGDFTGQITHAEVGGLEISAVRAGGQRVRRTSQLIARADEQYLLASIQTRGRGRVEQDGRVAVLDPGAMALYDSTRPYTLHFDDAFEQVVVQVPLVDILAESGLRDAGQVTAVNLGGGGPAGVVGRFFEGLSRAYARAATPSSRPPPSGLTTATTPSPNGWKATSPAASSICTSASRSRRIWEPFGSRSCSLLPPLLQKGREDRNGGGRVERSSFVKGLLPALLQRLLQP